MDRSSRSLMSARLKLSVLIVCLVFASEQPGPLKPSFLNTSKETSQWVLSREPKKPLLAKINAVRDHCNGLEDEINAVVWDGKEETRAQACDQIESVGWNYEG